MTMDVHKYRHYEENVPESKNNLVGIETETIQRRATELSAKPSKRSFDVAFLMLPDDKSKEKELRNSKQLICNQDWKELKICDNKINERLYDEKYLSSENSPGQFQDVTIDVGTDEYPTKLSYCSDDETSNESASRVTKYLPEIPIGNKVFDDPTLIMQARRFEQNRCLTQKFVSDQQKSAFTKVSHFVPSSSPSQSVSPESVTYQDSLSPPLLPSISPTANYKMSPFNNLLSPNNLMSVNPFLRGHQIQEEKRKCEFLEKHSEFSKLKSTSKSNGIGSFHPEMSAYLQPNSAYPFSMPTFQGTFPSPTRESVNPLIANPAAAILSTLLPPTLAAFSLPAQNMCAKCNISFRMTSDLVYHMRTQHKSETNYDPNRRRREEKLKCPVCAESFRERHHLTRHMTAHQDKESDIDGSTTNTQNHFYPKTKSKPSFSNSH